MRLLRLLPVAVMCLAVVSACTTANAGWTYAPAPSLTPQPSSAASAGASAGASAPAGSANPNVVTISAFGIKFEQTAVTAPAGKAFQIVFENKDAGIPHNVAIHAGSAPGTEVFKGEVFPGPATKTYDVSALDAGQYTFACTVHNSMTGTLDVK
jgi:plastocyanin